MLYAGHVLVRRTVLARQISARPAVSALVGGFSGVVRTFPNRLVCRAFLGSVCRYHAMAGKTVFPRILEKVGGFPRGGCLGRRLGGTEEVVHAVFPSRRAL